MFVDTHMHEMTCSKDSFLKLEEMVEIAREKGLGAISVSYTHLTLPTKEDECRSRWSPYH